jgi:hypothetical protein
MLFNELFKLTKQNLNAFVSHTDIAMCNNLNFEELH